MKTIAKIESEEDLDFWITLIFSDFLFLDFWIIYLRNDIC